MTIRDTEDHIALEACRELIASLFGLLQTRTKELDHATDALKHATVRISEQRTYIDFLEQVTKDQVTKDGNPETKNPGGKWYEIVVRLHRELMAGANVERVKEIAAAHPDFRDKILAFASRWFHESAATATTPKILAEEW